MKITNVDLVYAHQEMEKPTKEIFNERDWEFEVVVRNATLWTIILDNVHFGGCLTEESMDVNRRVRRVLTLVFAAVYSANRKRFPTITRDDFESEFSSYRDSINSAEAFETLRRNLRILLDKLSPELAKQFSIAFGSEIFPEYTKIFICVCVMTLVRRCLETMPKVKLSGTSSTAMVISAKAPAEVKKKKKTEPKAVPDDTNEEEENEANRVPVIDELLEEKKNHFIPGPEAGKITAFDQEFLKKLQVSWPEDKSEDK